MVPLKISMISFKGGLDPSGPFPLRDHLDVDNGSNYNLNVSIEVDLILVVLFLSVIIWTTGATVFSYCEHWEFFDALYFCFATLTTIGDHLLTFGSIL